MHTQTLMYSVCVCEFWTSQIYASCKTVCETTQSEFIKLHINTHTHTIRCINYVCVGVWGEVRQGICN